MTGSIFEEAMLSDDPFDHVLEEFASRPRKKACLRCRSSKIKCDYLKPCSSCVRSGCPGTCMEDQNPRSCDFCKQKKLKCNKLRPCDQCIKRARGENCSAPFNAASYKSAKAATRKTAEEEPATLPQGWGQQELLEPPPQAVQVHRPMPFALKITFSDTSEHRERESLRLHHVIFRRVWESGYSLPRLLRILNNLPHAIRQVLDEGLMALEGLRQIKCKRISPPSSPEVPTQDSSVLELVKDDNEGFLSSNDYIGFYAYEWDPLTQKRVSVQVSQCLASFLKMHPEEVLARVGHSDHFLPNSEIEFLGALFNELFRTNDLPAYRYQRLVRSCPKTGKILESMIVKSTASRQLDEHGRVVKTCHFLHHVRPWEYDEAMRLRPECCRPFLTNTGDRRSAHQLLSDANRDCLFEECFETWTKTPEGVGRLKKFVCLFRNLILPFKQELARLKALEAQNEMPWG
uniref:Zn(2)-C6 fungal-type domain-containing protein n=1 Tax=Guillardia theta TaxID=55529 RepID=A0A7S4KRM9_GUITH|mmetsp:Transcript_29682/g.94985  ORF Transcript_29682/g.94985 Transcript_29682/m.94985 type:complete len:460 (+) Transcript_29682:46-1425(+)